MKLSLYQNVAVLRRYTDPAKKGPALMAGQRRASSIHERLPDKLTSAGMPVSFSIDHILNTSRMQSVISKTVFEYE
jgi:hypothetical protein